uniref:Chromo domain-containing protein n=1 Tax=Leptobrachium leishanense TaxID=445787 RepID=A0A8C5MKS2_9ANUR
MVNSVAAHLILPPSYRIHPVFHVSLLKPWHENPFPDRNTEPPAPVPISGEEEYEISRILDSRLRYGKLEYLVHWKGYGPEEQSWEPSANIHAPAKHGATIYGIPPCAASLKVINALINTLAVSFQRESKCILRNSAVLIE